MAAPAAPAANGATGAAGPCASRQEKRDAYATKKAALPAGAGPPELEAAPEGSLVLCDLFGGTPSNVTASLLAAHAVCAVTGLNLAMLIEACTMRASMKGKTLAEAVLAAAAAGCRDLRKEIETMEADI